MMKFRKIFLFVLLLLVADSYLFSQSNQNSKNKTENRIYQAGNEKFSIPDSLNARFLKAFPNAVLIESSQAKEPEAIMPEKITSYQVDKDIFDIPDSLNAKFLKRYPDAVLIESPQAKEPEEIYHRYTLNGKKYAIPDSLNARFLRDYPDAKLIESPQAKEPEEIYHRYTLDGSKYAIPDRLNAKFLKMYPNAVLIESPQAKEPTVRHSIFDVNGKKYSVPHYLVKEFWDKHPGAYISQVIELKKGNTIYELNDIIYQAPNSMMAMVLKANSDAKEIKQVGSDTPNTLLAFVPLIVIIFIILLFTVIIPKIKRKNKSSPKQKGTNDKQDRLKQLIKKAPKQESGEIDYDMLLQSDPDSFADIWDSQFGAKETNIKLNVLLLNLETQLSTLQANDSKEMSLNEQVENRHKIAEMQQRVNSVKNILTLRNISEIISRPTEEKGVVSEQIVLVEERDFEIHNETKKVVSSIKMPKKRSGFVTAWLILVIVLNISIVSNNASVRMNALENAQFQSGILLFLVCALGFIDVFFMIMILNWKKWAFYGFVINRVLFFILLVVIDSSTTSDCILPIMGIFVMYGVLQIKKDGVSAWKQLE